MANRMGRDMSAIDSAPKAELKVGTRTCQCASCELFFTGVAPFDRHLVYDENKPDKAPVCLTPAQMRAIGMQTNIHGVWQYGKSKKNLRAA